MRALVDSQAFIWFSMADSKLGSRARDFMLDEANEIFVSSVVPWEIAIKHSLGRMPELTEGPDAFFLSHMAVGGFQHLPIEATHALAVGALPDIHKDPFDRMLVAQARVEGLVILTSDSHIGRYGVEVMW